jgi:hypothetical protein
MPSVLETDGYKFSMAAAGFPLRTETFYYSHRKGGPHYLPFDVEKEIRALLPGTKANDDRFLTASGYEMGGAFWAALENGTITVKALPKGTWFFDREPVFTVTDPSLAKLLNDFATQAGFTQFVNIGEADETKLAKLAAFVSKSISSQSQAFGSGSASVRLTF